MKNGGCWIFLSHSSHDIEKVRMIRNEFEAQGQNPLAFHLRCLTTDTPEGRAELDNLIKREIDSREWFVFCESPAAQQSQYVQMEKNYIFSTGKKKIWSIDMNLPMAEILTIVRRICQEIEVFISYSRADFEFEQRLEKALIAKDYAVWSDNHLRGGGPWTTQIEDAVSSVAEDGFCILIITEAYLSSQACVHELRQMLKSKAKIIPLVVGGSQSPAELVKSIRERSSGSAEDETMYFELISVLQRHTYYSIPAMPSAEDVHLIVDLIEEKLKSGIKGPIRLQADLYNKVCQIQEKLNYQKRYHSQEAVQIGCTGPMDDYCEIYEFPCCGTKVFVGDGPISRYRADGCCKDD